MVRVAPWYSAIDGVYHDNTACSEGQAISLANLRAGTGKRPLCEVCARFDEDERKRNSVDSHEPEDVHDCES